MCLLCVSVSNVCACWRVFFSLPREIERERDLCVCVCLILCNENEPFSDAQNRQKNYQTHTLHKGLNRAFCTRIVVGGGSNKF